MVNVYNTVSELLDSINLSSGETYRTNCPMCDGKNTFTVSNEMGRILWNCYKASCTVKGTNKVDMSVDDVVRVMSNADEVSSCDEFNMPEYLIKGHGDLDWAEAQYDLDPCELDLYYDVKEDRVVFPVKDGNEIVDAVGRSLKNEIPKWKRYGKSDLPYSFGSGNVAVVVEDCVSASVVGSLGNVVGVALMGTTLLSSHRVYLMQFSTAVIALDPDAFAKSFDMATELRGYVDDVRILNLEDDLKYRNPTDMEKLNGIINY